MGEMSLRNRHRNDLAVSFNRLRRMVTDIKSARKSLAAHHSLMAELVSVSLFSAVPSSKASSPPNPPCHLQLDDSQEFGNGSMPLGSPVPCFALPSRKPAGSGSWSPVQEVGIGPPNLRIDDMQEMGIGSPNLQVDESQNVGIMSLISQGPIPCLVLLTANSSPGLPASLISTSPTPSPPPSVWNGSLSALTCKNLEDADCARNQISVSFYQQIAANAGRLASQSVLWASLLLVFLCFFLFMGKEVAVGITITAYFVLWLTFKGRSFSKQIPRFMCCTEFHPQAIASMRRNRSSTFLKNVNDFLLSPSESHSCTRSQSWPMLHGCAQGEVHTTEPGLSINYVPSFTAGTHVARLKLGIMLVLALCGLAYGQIMAVCMCSCCILMVSEMQRLASKRCKQEIQYNTSLLQLCT